jgi:alkaline phosphatase D
VRNPVVLTGDIHSAWANDLKADYADPSSATIGAELICTSVTSGGDGTPATRIPTGEYNPHLKFYSARRGYTRTRITPDKIQADFRTVEHISEHGAPAVTAGSFVILDGEPGLQTV